MKAKQKDFYAALILRLLLNDSSELCWPDGVNWVDFIELAKRNVVLVRIAERLRNLGIKPPEEFSDEVDQERWRIEAKMTLIHKINHVCLAKRIEHIFVKDFQHYPDMGHDIDLWVSSYSTEVDAAIVKALNAAGKNGGLHNRIAGTTNYKVKGCDSPLEIHHGRMGSLGEHASYLSLLLKNARHVKVEGTNFLVPSPEDQLVVQGLQRVYERQYIRISDIVYTIGSIRRDKLDWSYIIKVSKQLGTFHGLCCYLSYTNQIYQELFKQNLFSLELSKTLNLAGWGQIEFRDDYFRFPRIRVASSVYLRKFRTALLANNWDGASRLCLLPVVAVSSLLRRRFGWVV
jgi:putative nucleotidyltransferase-like protein